MLTNMYAPLSGAKAQERAMEIIANNLANVNTVGFKAENLTFKLLAPEPEKNYLEPLPTANYKIPFEEILPLRGNDISYVGVSGVYEDFTQGPVMTTNNPLDVMVEGEGFLTVMTREGERYTRNGSLTLDSGGLLVDQFGNAIMGEKGQIFLSKARVEINHLGEIYQDGEMIDRLLVSNFANPDELARVGSNLYHYEGPPEDMKPMESPTIRQGFLEGSNVNAITNLTQMIIAHRSYEAYQKAIKNYDSMLEKSANSIGSLRA